MILCPNCNKEPLFLVIEQRIAFTLQNIGFIDVIPKDRIDESGHKILECIGCGWRGWVGDYHQAKNGVINISCRETEGVDL